MQSNRVVDVSDDCESKFYLFALCAALCAQIIRRLTSRMDLVKPYTH